MHESSDPPACFLIPEGLRRLALTRGPEGRAWLEQLPVLVAEFERLWSIKIGPAFEGSFVGFAAPATLNDGTPAVFKISIPYRETKFEAEALRLYDGDGAIRLFLSDRARCALLVERCIPGTALIELADEDEANTIAAGILRRLWRPVPADHPFDLAADRATEWAQAVQAKYKQFSNLVDRHLADQASALFRELAQSTHDHVLLHQDFHQGNVLAAHRRPWLAIDPKPLVGDRAFDVATLLWDRTEALLSDTDPPKRMQHRLDHLSSELALDRSRVRAWAVARAVELALWSLSIEDADGGLQQIECARLLAGT